MLFGVLMLGSLSQRVIEYSVLLLIEDLLLPNATEPFPLHISNSNSIEWELLSVVLCTLGILVSVIIEGNELFHFFMITGMFSFPRFFLLCDTLSRCA